MMSRRVLITIAFCFACSVGVVLFLFLISGMARDDKNSFLRVFPPHPVKEGKWITLGSANYYFAGTANKEVYFGHYKNPLRIIQLNTETMDTVRIDLTVPGFFERRFWSPRIKVDSPNFFVTDGAVPVIFKGNINDATGTDLCNDSLYFRDFVPFNDRNYAVRSLSHSPRENMLGRISLDSPHLQFNKNILEKQIDGIFCTDGMLRLNRSTKQLVYLYYYRNEFIVMDTALSVITKGHTIDTVSRARIKTGTIESEHATTLSSPPYFVNLSCAVHGEWLWVHSALRADNESEEAFSNASVIDVYHLSSSRYQFSFYIYHFNGKEMSEFVVLDNKVVVRYGSVVRVFDIEKEYFKDV
jgi:hypothetical protein